MNALSEKIIREQSVVMEEVVGHNNFGRFWAFVLVRADGLEAFRAQLQHGCKLTNCCTILAKGSGQPPADLRQHIMRDLGMTT